jgi:hypothetical protein
MHTGLEVYFAQIEEPRRSDVKALHDMIVKAVPELNQAYRPA